MPSSLNGTGVTFNDATTLQSGAIPAANLGTGSPGSGNFLRGDRTWATVPASAPSTADVLNAYAGAQYGAVGTYTTAFSQNTNADTELAAGSTVAGSNLRRFNTGFNYVIGFVEVASGGNLIGLGLSGTWRLMMPTRNANVNNSGLGGIYLRIS